MLRYGFTLWFALTALLGPGVCYRALAASVARTGEPTVAVDHEPAGPPDARFAADSDGATAGGGEPPTCPPGQGKKAQALPPTASPDAAAELRLPVGATSLPPSLVPTDPPTGNPTGSASAPLPPPLAGRDLLAAYCLLRC